jgi:hypothetical protein
MSNRNDFNFDDDDFNNFDDDFDFPADDFPAAPDDDFDSDLPSNLDSDTGESGGGPNRTFVIIAALLVLLFVLGLGAVIFLFVQNQGPSPIQLTSTAIANINSTTIAQGNLTATQNAILALTQTQQAMSTDTPSPTATNTPPPTFTPTPTQDATLVAFAQFQTQTAEFLTQQALDLTATALGAESAGITQTALALTQNANATLTAQAGPAIDTTSVALTATALAGIFNGAGGGDATPTAEGAGGTGGVARPTALPDTGLFDDIAAGNSGSFGLIALAAFGLVGVIIVSRRLRSTGK